MEANYLIEGVIVLLVVLMVIYLISRNKKDLTEYEKEINQSEIKPEKHGDDHV